MNRTLLCFIQGRGDLWEAICVDLDIAVAGRSFDEAKSFLERAIRMYVEAASQEEPVARERLLNRRAPLGLRLWIVARHVYVLLSNRTGEAEGGFRLPCPA